jgi:hypothetical protein
MRISKQVYLVLERLRGRNHQIRIAENLGQVLSEWKSSTRISPIYPITFSNSTPTLNHRFKGEFKLLFIGPIHPQDVIASPSEVDAAWAGYGLLNTILIPNSEKTTRRLLQLARERQLGFELWRIKDGKIQDAVQSETGTVERRIGKSLSRLSAGTFAPEVREAIHEFCPLMASTLARCGYLPSSIRTNLDETERYVDATVKDATKKGAAVSSYRLLGQLLTLNAGLSRFSSQTFAGTVPIEETECHFWSHSLLGIGMASIGLWRMTEFIEETLGRARLPERFAEFSKMRDSVPNLRTLDINHPFWTTDHLGKIALPPDKPEPIVPLLSYFSARDGFRSTPTTISAPLASVTSCNSPRWSLLTITHEITHVVIRAILTEVYPDFDDPQQLDACLSLLEQNGPSNTLLEEIRKLLLITIFNMDKGGKNQDVDVDEETLTKTIERSQREVEEIFVHVFDFLYFYGRDLDKYIGGIWASWGTIPNIATRVPDYVIRSICAALSNHIRREKGEEIARDQVVESLKKLQRNSMGGTYVDAALKYINDHWQDELRQRVMIRKELVKIVQAFLFSTSVATKVRGEPAISGGATEKEGYTLRRGELEKQAIRNPLHFLELYSVTVHSSPVESLWIYYVLAFSVGA